MTISPPYLRNMFANVSNVHTYNLRNSLVKLYISKPKFEIEKCSLHYRGSVILDKLPIQAREQESLDLRIVILSNYETRSKDLLVELGEEVLEG